MKTAIKKAVMTHCGPSVQPVMTHCGTVAVMTHCGPLVKLESKQEETALCDLNKCHLCMF